MTSPVAFLLPSGLALGLALALVSQALLLGLFLLRWRHLSHQQRQWPGVPVAGWPELEVLLCLRGADSTLPALLTSLARQRYPGRWHLQVVVDRVEDPAWGLVDPWLNALEAGWSSIRRQPLHRRPQRGSLKCAALRQACAALQPGTQLVVLLDADATLMPDGLQRLARACWRPGVGAVSGNRWYAPAAGGVLAWTRAVWGAAALVLMTLLQIPWGGCLALRRELVEVGGWCDLLAHGLCEDTGLLGPLRRLGLRYEARPELVVVEGGGVSGWCDLAVWISRQLLNVRLHHPAWPLVLGYGLGSSLVLVGLLVALLQGAWWLTVAYELGCWCLLLALQRVVHPRRPTAAQALGWGLGLLPGQLINSITSLGAAVQRQVVWRAVRYRVTRQPPGVRMCRER